jgi:uncharacterized protein YegP (UPF0339 family)
LLYCDRVAVAQRRASVVPHRFKITAAKNGEFAAKFVYNGETMLWSENYKSKASAQNCIDSVKKNAPGAAIVDTAKGEEGKGYRFELAASKDGQTFVRFVAANGEPMVRSETYKSRASAKNCIKSLQERGPKAETVDET